MIPTHPGEGVQSWRHWLRAHGGSAFAGGIAVLAVLSGHFGLSRLMPDWNGQATELRLWATLALAVLALRRWRMGARIPADALWVVVPFGVFCLVLAARSVPDIATPSGTGYVIDAGLLLIQVLAITVLGVDADTRTAILGWSVAVGLLLFVGALAGIGRPEINGPGWAPIGSPVTFSRLEMFAASAALSLAFLDSRRPWPKYGGVAAFAAGLHGTLASLSRIAVVAAPLTVLWIGVWLAARRRFRLTAAAIGAALLVAVVFSASNGVVLLAKFTDAANISVYAVMKGETPNLGIVYDTTGRSDLWLHALLVFSKAPLLGAGPTGFRVPKTPRFVGDSDVFTYPHNVVLEVLAMAGGLGGLALLAAVVLPLVPVLRANWKADAAIPLSGYLGFAFLASSFGGDLYDGRLYWVAAMLTILVGLQAQRTVRS